MTRCNIDHSSRIHLGLLENSPMMRQILFITCWHLLRKLEERTPLLDSVTSIGIDHSVQKCARAFHK